MGDVDYLLVVVDVVSASDVELVAVAAVAAAVVARLVVLVQRQLEQREQHAQLVAEPFLLHLPVVVQLMAKVPSLDMPVPTYLSIFLVFLHDYASSAV